MALEACERITNSDTKMQLIERDQRKYLTQAKSTDAMQEGVKFRPVGAWASSRGGNYDRGSRIR